MRCMNGFLQMIHDFRQIMFLPKKAVDHVWNINKRIIRMHFGRVSWAK